MRTRNRIVRAAAVAVLALAAQAAWAAGSIEVLKSPYCGCCGAWGDHMRQAGFAVTERNLEPEALDAAKKAAGVTPELASCHTARIDGYVIEGHVPAADVERLLAERPDAIGLAVPQMPYGSPGMGEAGADADPYDVLLIRRDGSTEVFASYR